MVLPDQMEEAYFTQGWEWHQHQPTLTLTLIWPNSVPMNLRPPLSRVFPVVPSLPWFCMRWDRFLSSWVLKHKPWSHPPSRDPTASVMDILYCLRIIQFVFVCIYLVLLIYSVANPGWWLHLSYSLGLNYSTSSPFPAIFTANLTV